MVQRVNAGSFAGAVVFPGGKLDDEDSSASFLSHIDGSENVLKQLDMYKICAVREAFEETGLLCANRKTDKVINVENVGKLNRRGNFLEICKKHDLKLSTSELKYFVHLVTPEYAPKRFDVHFFVLSIDDHGSGNGNGNGSASGHLLEQAYLVGSRGALQTTEAEKKKEEDTCVDAFENRVTRGEIVRIFWMTPKEYLELSQVKKKIVLYTPQVLMLKLMSRFKTWQALDRYVKLKEHKRLCEFNSHIDKLFSDNPEVAFSNFIASKLSLISEVSQLGSANHDDLDDDLRAEIQNIRALDESIMSRYLAKSTDSSSPSTSTLSKM
ncbi:hypothetical protein AX774_g3448 [Zancudomyces culisetae]|uniref:Nudix hydrolase domain-containing protein n=1 Tax=Zancudomyces culisetae TaxID=1213189 RepID=A0A1R1PQ11_ZANCU|nr:hypothetical protein AX774_g3448 [Zancudomyces culisetae]|eukprot:OMH83047.1 hypothetical protein AX774_g3448 [Zancudomyces culisetae]